MRTRPENYSELVTRARNIVINSNYSAVLVDSKILKIDRSRATCLLAIVHGRETDSPSPRRRWSAGPSVRASFARSRENPLSLRAL